jgi:class 3 adenylate cyclase/tetratricopeptide (TPR) repeat protein
MTFDELLAQIRELLQREQRLSYRALKRRFDLDDDYLEDLKEELIYAKRLAADEEGRVLVWLGDPTLPPPLATAPLQAQERPPLAYTPTHLAEKILTARHALEGERKQVTVLFADLKDSTELIRGLDPEAAQQLLDPAIHIMMDAVHRFEGTVNQVLGDGIMALFGAPIAHEDHALRACYAALAMQAAMQPYTEEVRRSRGLELRMRVGLNAGEVVVRAIGNDLHMDYSAVGETTHLAARMEQMATPGTIRLTAATLRLVEGLVQANALGPVPVKGLAEPVEVFELLGASAIRRRLQAAAARGLTRFVSRQQELETLQQALERVAAGHGQVVALVGEAGVGKSRLVYEVIHSHRTQGWLVLESASVSYGKATPYFPVLELLKRYVRLDDRDTPRTVRARVTGHVLTLDEALQDTVPSLLALLDVLPENSPFLALEPPQRRQRTLEALKRVLLRESQVQPLLLICEDLHWIDAETQALLDSLTESLPTARLLLLVNYRPEYQHGWGSKTYYTQLRLDPLPPVRADEFLQALLGDDPSLLPLKRLLIARTQGNPFFLEESVRALVETGVLAGERGAYRLVQPVESLQVPATVQAILAARVDRLPAEAKRLMQTAAVIGTEVPWPLLQAIADAPEAMLERGLAHLQAAEFLYETSLFPERVYTFKHALTHEVAYQSLLQERRRALHARVVAAIEALAGDRREEQVDRLAQHALRGEVWDKAVTYFRQAGTKARQRSANREAIECYEPALVALARLPESRDTLEQALDLRLNLSGPLTSLLDFERNLNNLHTAETLAQTLGDQRRLVQVYGAMTNYFRMTGAPDRALAFAQRALTLGAPLEDVGLQARVYQQLGQVYHTIGDYRRGMDVLGRSVATLQGALLYEDFSAVNPASVGSLHWLNRCRAEVGAFTEGLAEADVALRVAEAVNRPSALAETYQWVGILHLYKGDVHRAIPVLERALDLCRTWDLPLYFPTTASTLGYAYTLCGRLAEGMPLLEQAVERTVAEDGDDVLAAPGRGGTGAGGMSHHDSRHPLVRNQSSSHARSAGASSTGGGWV